MPCHGKKKSPAQKRHTDEMRKHGLALRSSQKATAINPVDPRTMTKQQKARAKKDKAHRRLIRNGQRREERLKEKVSSQGKVIVSLNGGGGDTERPSEGDRFSGG